MTLGVCWQGRPGTCSSPHGLLVACERIKERISVRRYFDQSAFARIAYIVIEERSMLGIGNGLFRGSFRAGGVQNSIET